MNHLPAPASLRPLGLRPGRALAIALALTSLPAATGCDSGSDPSDPRGGDATFNFTWRINGQDPRDASDPCTAAGIGFIRMTVVDNDNTEHRYDAFRFDCRLGTYRSATPELREGAYRVYWEAVARDGQRVSLASGTFDRNGVLQPTLEMLNVTRGNHVDFDAVNRPDGTFPGAPTNFATGASSLQVALRFAATPGATEGATCETAGAASVTWTLRRSNNVIAEARTERAACSAGFGTLTWDMLDFDRYSLEVQGFDNAGQVRWRGACPDLLLRDATPASMQQSCLLDRLP